MTTYTSFHYGIGDVELTARCSEVPAFTIVATGRHNGKTETVGEAAFFVGDVSLAADLAAAVNRVVDFHRRKAVAAQMADVVVVSDTATPF